MAAGIQAFSDWLAASVGLVTDGIVTAIPDVLIYGGIIIFMSIMAALVESYFDSKKKLY